KVLVTGTPGGRATRGPKRHRRHLLECHGKAATTSADLLGNFRLLTRVRQAIDRARQRAVARRSVGQGAGALSSRRSRPACVQPVARARIFSLPYRIVLCASARAPESVQVDAEAVSDRLKSHATPPPDDPLAQSLSVKNGAAIHDCFAKLLGIGDRLRRPVTLHDVGVVNRDICRTLLEITGGVAALAQFGSSLGSHLAFTGRHVRAWSET